MGEPREKSNKSSQGKSKNFASFDLTQAFKQLGVKHMLNWELEVQSIKPSEFFQQRLTRLRRFFDLRSYEESKKLLIDAICEEALEDTHRLKIWKGAALKSDELNGNVDYLIAENKEYLEAPLLCIVEAKKDDFEQGLAQCLVEMQACWWNNQQLDHVIDIFGIVTNGETWRFYMLASKGDVYETPPYSIGDLERVLGLLRHIFHLCEQNLIQIYAA
ncbi:MAG: hypothetical protein QNJ46_15715 [Leptolyngbyaceae cyanobacterium MO_188.B28]|nr:hypothetical protein [Leptolyngbyaceae cyanobacterium MO_188.B28]